MSIILGQLAHHFCLTRQQIWDFFQDATATGDSL